MDESAGSLSYLWQVPAKPVKVSIRLNVVDRLGAAVMAGFKSLPRRGLETGGLLLGTERRTGRGVIVEIHDFEPLECEHAFGPSYLLSAADRQVLEERLVWHKSSGEESVVGFYRSHTRREFSLTVEDIDLMTAWFPRESNIFLLLQSNGDAPPTAGFVIWEGKKIRSSVPYAKFEFARSALATSGAICASPPPVWPTVLEPLPEPESEPLREPPDRQRMAHGVASLSGWWSALARRVDWAWIAAAVIVVATLLTAALLRHDANPQISSVPLGLDVRHDGTALRLLWNHDASVVQSATRAVLWIGDGERQSKLDLDATQLAGGSIMYWPSTSDVNFRMEVYSATSRGSESVRAVGAPASPSPSPSPWPPESRMLVASPPARPPSHTVAGPDGTADRAANRINETAPAADRPSTTLVRRWSPPAMLINGGARPTILEVPVPEPIQSAAPPLLVTEVMARLPVAADPMVDVDAEPLPGIPRGGLLSRLHLVSRPDEIPGFVPPRPLHRPSLAVPPDLRSRARIESPIDVRLYIDPTGKVEYAELEGEASQADRDLAALAVFSSRRWQFDPAHIGRRKVPGEVILRYRFGTEN